MSYLQPVLNLKLQLKIKPKLKWGYSRVSLNKFLVFMNLKLLFFFFFVLTAAKNAQSLLINIFN